MLRRLMTERAVVGVLIECVPHQVTRRNGGVAKGGWLPEDTARLQHLGQIHAQLTAALRSRGVPV